MATQILAVGEGAATSADITVDDGATATVALKGAAKGASVDIELKDDAGAYVKVDALTPSIGDNAKILGPGTYRLARVGAAACGAFRA